MSEVWKSPRRLAAEARQSRIDMVDAYADATSYEDEDGMQQPNEYRLGAVALMEKLDEFAGEGPVTPPSIDNLYGVIEAEMGVAEGAQAENQPPLVSA